MSQDASKLFTRLAPILNVTDLAAERAFYEKLGLPVIYQGPEYPDFIAFGTDTLHFGIQAAPAEQRSAGRAHLADRRHRHRQCHSAMPLSGN